MQDDAERYIEMIDAAIHYANTRLRSEAKPGTAAHETNASRRARAVRQRQAELDELARKLAKPEQ